MCIKVCYTNAPSEVEHEINDQSGKSHGALTGARPAIKGLNMSLC